jgi:urea transporter
MGQIMFQDSPWTGAFFLTGIAIVSPVTAAGGALGAMIGTLTAMLLKYDEKEIRDGIYGFNASLVGIAMIVNYQPELLTFALVILGSAVSTMLTREMRRRVPFPTYTTPFVVTTWVVLFMANELSITPVVPPKEAEGTLDIASAVVRGVSEVMLQANVLTGMLFLVGILLRSWRGAVWALVGSLVGLLTGLSHSAPEPNLSLGIYGYNAALAAMAMTLYRRSVTLPLFAVILSVPVTEIFPVLGLKTLTAPFVIACWAVIGMDKLDQKLYADQAPPFAD